MIQNTSVKLSTDCQLLTKWSLNSRPWHPEFFTNKLSFSLVTQTLPHILNSNHAKLLPLSFVHSIHFKFPLLPLSIGFPRQDSGMGCHFLLNRIFLTQGSNLRLLHYSRWILYHWANCKAILFQFYSILRQFYSSFKTPLKHHLLCEATLTILSSNNIGGALLGDTNILSQSHTLFKLH